MAEFVTKVRTERGDFQIDYRSLANLPKPDETLSKSGEFVMQKQQVIQLLNFLANSMPI